MHGERGFSLGSVIAEGLSRLDGMEHLQDVGPDYPALIDRLVERHDADGVTVFTGGPLDLRRYGIETGWLSPAEVRDTEGASQFHLLYLNTKPGVRGDNPRVVFNIAPESALKVGDFLDDAVADFRDALLGTHGSPTIIVRPSFAGSLYYPEVATPATFTEPRDLERRLAALGAAVGFDIRLDALSRSDIARRQFRLWSDSYPTIAIGWRERYLTEFGEVFMYPVLHPSDPWQYYEVYTAQPLSSIDRKVTQHVRLDSGCDIGQMYLDDGCDCRQQFRHMLEHLTTGGGLIIHAPTQDGRGYGMGTKMETEGMKRGVPVVFNRERPEPMGTLTAAKLLFGEERFDIRTFHGMGTVLRELGFSSVYLHTDSRKKVDGIASVGVDVVRVPTDTAHDTTLTEDCRNHVAEKHAAGSHYFPDC